MYSFQEMKYILGIQNSKTNIEFQKEFSQHFFYANVCQYCSDFKSEIGTAVKRCSSCEAMFYCSKEHQKKHYQECHKEFCETLSAVKLASKEEYLFQDLSEKKMTVQNYLMDVTEMTMKRPLHRYEVNMFMYPRVCIICSEGNPSLLKSCPKCPHANFCTRHLNITEHGKFCNIYTYCFFIDQFSIVFKDFPLENFLNVFPRNSRYTELPISMDVFLDLFIKPYHPEIDFRLPEIKVLISTVFTRPLTLIYALQKLKFLRNTELLVHVISKKRFEETNFVEWEVLFHWFPTLRFLKVAFIGTHISPKKIVPRLCENCIAMKRNLKVEISELVYKDYYKKTSRQPDIIIAYDVDFMTHCTWKDASSLLSSLNTPIVLTSMDYIDLLRGMRDCVSNPLNFSEIDKNPFSSLKPERGNFSDAFYSNYVISIHGDIFPKVCDILEDQISPNELKSLEDLQINPVLKLEQKNNLLKQKYELYTKEIEKLKDHNNKTRALLQELMQIIDLYYNVEDRLYKHFAIE